MTNEVEIHGVKMRAEVFDRIKGGVPPDYTEEEFRAYSAVALAKERAAFEAWAPTAHLSVERWDVNPEMYDDEDAISAWSGWQARAAQAQQAEPTEWAGAGAFIQHVQVAAGLAGSRGHWPDEFLAWYKPADWLGEHRAAAVFLGKKLATPTPAPAAEPLTDERVSAIYRALGITFMVPGDYDRNLFTSTDDVTLKRLVRAVERAHGIKAA